MAANQSAAPIIIKKVKKGGHGHHGGAWKVAFADFVTAMMAFFMLMWLMGSTTPEQKATAEAARMVRIMEELKAVIDAGKELKDFADQILFDITPEGLRIQIIDKENRAMFDQGSARLQPYTRAILHEMVKVISEAPNRISVSGHTDAKPYATDSDYGNWELSADRANAARRELLAGGLPEDKIGRVVGLGSSDLLDPSQPQAPLNRRISIVVLRGDHGKRVAIDGNGAAAQETAAPATDAGVIDEPATASTTPVVEPPGAPTAPSALPPPAAEVAPARPVTGKRAAGAAKSARGKAAKKLANR